MTLDEFVREVNRAQARTPFGRTPSVTVIFPGNVEGREARIEFGDAKIDGKVVDRRYLQVPGRGRVLCTAARFECEPAMRALRDAGLCAVEGTLPSEAAGLEMRRG